MWGPARYALLYIYCTYQESTHQVDRGLLALSMVPHILLPRFSNSDISMSLPILQPRVYAYPNISGNIYGSLLIPIIYPRRECRALLDISTALPILVQVLTHTHVCFDLSTAPSRPLSRVYPCQRMWESAGHTCIYGSTYTPTKSLHTVQCIPGMRGMITVCSM